MTTNRYANPSSEASDRATILGSDRHLRRDSRDIARLLSLGVVDETRVKTILTKVYDRLDDNTKPGGERNLVALMKVVIAAAKLEQDSQPREHVHDHTHTVLTDEQRAAIREARELRAELERRGLVIDGQVVEVRAPQAIPEATDVS